ncbi:hypothetical protein ABW20_dc0107266 [Dactylellina cionopaga]|nr:hypothetical protein ABW20_dc0107266 [Dactylellina cionopaga]
MKTFTSIIALTLALSVAAAPAPLVTGGGVDNVDATCSPDMKVQCCNKEMGPSPNGIANGLTLFGECTSLDIFGGIGGAVHDILSKKCASHTVCCQNNAINQEGAINVGTPCFPIGPIVKK